VTLQEEKSAARKAAFARRKLAFDADPGNSSWALSAVLAGYRGVPVSGFLPIRTEIDPRPAMEEAAAHGPVAVPVIIGADQPLKFSLWQPGCALRAGPFGALVPEVDRFVEPEIVIVPLLAFTPAGGRLGYGGGYYDRTLEQLRRGRATLAIGFAYAAQEAGELPLEATDQPLDMIVTDQGVLTPQKR
jgi:5-formyltetrahydrofolate cyclo-ligase